MGNTSRIAERSIVTKLFRISHMTVCPFQMRCYRQMFLKVVGVGGGGGDGWGGGSGGPQHLGQIN